MTAYVSVSLDRLAIAAAFIAIAAFISRQFGLDLGKSLAVGMLRAAAQLVLVGYVLVFLFHAESAWIVLGTLTMMLLVAAVTSCRRVEHGPGTWKLFPWATLAIAAGSLVAVLPLFVFILPIHPWYDARYLIPLTAMMLSSAMNVVAQVFERVFSLAHDDHAQIEQLLALGASPGQAVRSHARQALRAALVPTLNTLATAGLVSLPGMMTGQILSGVDPVQAVRYQLVILYQLVAVAAVSGALAAVFSRRMLFNAEEELVSLEKP